MTKRIQGVLFQNPANLLSNSMQTKDNNWTPHLGKPSMSSIRSLEFAKNWHYSRRRADKLTELYLRPHLGRTCSISTTDNWNALDFNIRCKSTTIDQIGVRQIHRKDVMSRINHENKRMVTLRVQAKTTITKNKTLAGFIKCIVIYWFHTSSTDK